jgi:hypothetical protein
MSYLPWYLYVLLSVAVVGVAFVLTSRNKSAKRIALPITNAAFHSVVLLAAFSGNATLRVSLPVLVVIVLVNIILVQLMVLYCDRCGGTYLALAGGWARRLCTACGRRN